MVQGYINQFLLAFRCYTMGQVVPLPALTLRHPYPVVRACRVTGRNGRPANVFTLQSDYGVTLKIYLPRLYVRCIDNADINDINLERIKLKLQYLGPSVGLTHVLSFNV
jgi:hypothetical protein